MDIPNNTEGKIAVNFAQAVQDALKRKGVDQLEGAYYNAVFDTMYDFVGRIFAKDADEEKWVKENAAEVEPHGYQACYKKMRGQNCEHALKTSSGTKLNHPCCHDDMLLKSGKYLPCTELATDCPLHQKKDGEG